MDIVFALALSAHVGFENDYNPIHPRIGVEYENVGFGAYYNSESNISNYVSYTLDLTDDLNIEMGLVTGYSDYDVTPMARMNYKNMFVAPATENRERLGVVFGYEFKLKK